jgi:ArsR family transcriptional regulator, arsenate/arsenite/antimonite-responsive transcriptional repressor
MKADAALDALHALAHPTRLAAFRTLVQAGSHGLAVGELRDTLEVPPATLTAHLNVLRGAELVLDEREGRVIRLRANYARMNGLIAYLTENCCAGDAPCGPAVACTPKTTRRKAITSP